MNTSCKAGFSIGSLVIVIALVLVGAAGVYFYAVAPSDGSGIPPPTVPPPAPTPGPITLAGEITCLPHRGDGQTTLECAYGLRGDDGSYYGLGGIDQQRFVSGEIAVGKRVQVSGDIAPPTASERYNIAGAITVRSISVLLK